MSVFFHRSRLPHHFNRHRGLHPLLRLPLFRFAIGGSSSPPAGGGNSGRPSSVTANQLASFSHTLDRIQPPKVLSNLQSLLSDTALHKSTRMITVNLFSMILPMRMTTPQIPLSRTSKSSTGSSSMPPTSIAILNSALSASTLSGLVASPLPLCSLRPIPIGFPKKVDSLISSLQCRDQQAIGSSKSWLDLMAGGVPLSLKREQSSERAERPDVLQGQAIQDPPPPYPPTSPSSPPTPSHTNCRTSPPTPSMISQQVRQSIPTPTNAHKL